MRNLRKTYCHRFRRKHAVIPSRKRIANTVGTLCKAQRVVPPWHIEICCRPERQQLRLERYPLSATVSPPQGERLREQTVGVKRFSLAGTTVSLCKNKETGVHIQSKRRWGTPALSQNVKCSDNGALSTAAQKAGF